MRFWLDLFCEYIAMLTLLFLPNMLFFGLMLAPAIHNGQDLLAIALLTTSLMFWAYIHVTPLLPEKTR